MGLGRGMDAMNLFGRDVNTFVYIFKTFFPQLHQMMSKHPRVVQLLPIFLAAYMGASVFTNTIESWRASLKSFLLKCMTSSVTLRDGDRLHDALFLYFCSTTLCFPKSHFDAISLDFIKNKSDKKSLQNELTLSGKIKNVIFIPSQLEQIFFYKRTLFYYTNDGQGQCVLRCLGWSARPIRDMLEELLQSYNVEKSKTVIAVSHPFEDTTSWAWSIEVPARSLKSVSMDGQDKLSLIADVESFLKGRQWYKDRGMPWRRGYLFYGPPGTGKSTTVMALASHFTLPVFSLQFHPTLTDMGLLGMLRRVDDQNGIILLEDIDSSGIEDRRGDCTQNEFASAIPSKPPSQVVFKNTRVTLSGLLNALDGPSSPEGAIYIMTTNHANRLDPALIRPGRIDYRLKFDLASQEQARSMFLHVYGPASADIAPETLEELASTFASQIPDKKISPATLQDFFLRYRNVPLQAVDAVSKWVKGQGKMIQVDNVDKCGDGKKLLAGTERPEGNHCTTHETEQQTETFGEGASGGSLEHGDQD
ncbi:uncharacterized protein A1O9_02524 [Exophiala aquamarina CBS 119918]|uniref:AAA+ ATPase domain-containing protein n=1 Tax=Exophiala aquamarina CBS 119918 TaxID=1182545 RepID=A0A072PZA5_9EURO|nr:uncharacterized protein A1O9_02524 [Exophiala aquamarina CBS 119918]KEF60960.1 hypothetical protein A1O9_02524 [Exophiala aquamarina CBS 119918]